MEKAENINANFLNNLDYILNNLEKDIFKANNLEEKLFFDMYKSEIINSLNYVYKNIKYWKENFNEKKYEKIVNNYNEIESIISQLELCLADYEEEFHMDGISYSIFEIGKILKNIMEGDEKNDR